MVFVYMRPGRWRWSLCEDGRLEECHQFISVLGTLEDTHNIEIAPDVNVLA